MTFKPYREMIGSIVKLINNISTCPKMREAGAPSRADVIKMMAQDKPFTKQEAVEAAGHILGSTGLIILFAAPHDKFVKGLLMRRDKARWN